MTPDQYRHAARRIIRAVLALDCACPEQAFVDDGILSSTLAVGLGYWPAWTELRALDAPPDAETS